MAAVCIRLQRILNPGRIEEYKPQTGNDKGVQEFLETKTEMPQFIDLIKI